MALFPSSPTNGQQVTVNGIEYTYNSSQTAWIRTGATISQGDLVVGGNLSVAGNSTLGSNANVKISGGSSGYVLSTDGASNLSWVAQSAGGGSSISNGTSNVNIATSGGNVTTSVAGNANVLVVTGTGANVNGAVTATQFVSNVATGTAPFVVNSTTVVANLNAMQVDGYDASTANTANTLAARDASGNIAANFFIGNGSQLTGIITSVSNVSNGNSNVNIPAANGNVNISAAGNANVLIVSGVGANVTGTMFVNGNVIGANVYANSGTIGAGNLVGTLTTAASSQPNITTVGTLGSLSVTNKVTAGQLQGDGGNISNIQGANVSGTVSSATSATTAGTVTTAAQPNITSVGTLTSLGVNGTVTAVNFTANTGVFTGNGSGLTDLIGANVSGTVANANYSAYAGNATYATHVTDNSQPNITSLGTLTGLVMGGNITPNANITYDLGNNTNRFRDLYLANSTIYLGSQTISANASGVSISGNLAANVVGNITGSLANGNSNISIAANSDVTVSVAGNANVLTVTGSAANIAGAVNVTGNVQAANLRANNEVYANILSLNTGGVVLPADVGDLVWDDMVKTVSIRLENGEMLHIGQENNYLVQANTNLTMGQVVSFVGVSANIILGDPANLQAPGFVGDYVMGIAGSDIDAGNLGYVTNFGTVHDINTNSFNVGDILYADPATPGGLTNVIPTGANAKVQVGAVLHKGTIDGIVFARTNFFPTVEQLSGVSAVAPNNNQYLRYTTTGNNWVPANLQISNDPTPNLGGNLNANNFSFTSVNDITANTANFSGAVLTTASISNPLQLATKQYVDQSTSAGIHIHTPVRVEAPGALTTTYTQGGTTPTITTISGGNVLTTSTTHGLAINDIIVFDTSTNGLTAGIPYVIYSVPASNQITLSLTYGPGLQVTGLTNGTGLSITSRANSGVGATLTNAGTQTALVLGGVTMNVGDRVLIYEQTNAYENGVYTVTNVGSGSTNWVLTRALDQDTYAPQETYGMGAGDYFYVQAGYAAGESYVMTTEGIIILGTTPITYTLFSASIPYTGVSPVVVSGQNISLANTTGLGDSVVLANTPTLITPNIGAATGTSLDVSTGNINAGNLNVTIANVTGNVLAGNVFANAGNVNANIYLGGRISVGGNIDGGDFNPSGNLAASGYVSGVNLYANSGQVKATTGNFSGNVDAAYFIGNGAFLTGISGGGGTPGGSNTYVQFNNAGSFGGTANFTYNDTTQLLSITGTTAQVNVGANTYIANNSIILGDGSGFTDNAYTFIDSTGVATQDGNSTVGNARFAGIDLNSGISYANGNFYTYMDEGGMFTSDTPNNTYVYAYSNGWFYTQTAGGNGLYSSNTTFSWLVSDGNGFTANANLASHTQKFIAPQLESNAATGTSPLLIASNTLVANLNADLLDGFNSAQAATANTVVVRNANGNIAANFYTGNGSQLTGITVSTISNGNSSVNIPAANGNVNISAVGNTTFVVTGTGANITGTIGASGNITGANLIANTNVFTPSITTAATNGNLTIDPNGTGFAVFGTTTPVVIANGTTQTTAGLQLTGAPLGTNNDFGLLHVGNNSLTFNDTDIIVAVTANANSYAQMIMQNQSANNTASADFVVNNDTSSGATVYGDFGINSTTFAASGPFGGANTVYVYSSGGNLGVGTLTTHSLFLATANTTRITIDNNGNTSISGNVAVSVGANANVLSITGSTVTLTKPLTFSDATIQYKAAPNITVGTSAPVSPSIGDLWVDTN